MIARIMDDIDDTVRKVRFPEWQATNAGEREVRKALRRTLFKYKLHTDAELFETCVELARPGRAKRAGVETFSGGLSRSFV